MIPPIKVRAVNEMKRTAMILSLLVACILLCGCGKKDSSPYLTEEQRSELNRQIAESITITYQADYAQSAEMRIENRSDYNLSDFYLMRRGSNTVVGLYESFPAQTKAVYSAYSEVGWDQLAKSDPQFYFRYTIGAYSYTSEDMMLNIVPKEAGSEDARPLEILLETADGTIPLDLSGKTEFSTGTELNGLSTARIYSMDTSVSYSEYGDYYYSLKFETEGKKPSSGELVYKLLDQDGLIWYSNYISFYSGDTQTVYISAYLDPGTYTLRFEEIA